MRLEFSANTPVAEQLLRVAEAKRVGRKHNHQASNKAKQRRKNTELRAEKLRATNRRNFSLKVSAYFAGELEIFPRKKPV